MHGLSDRQLLAFLLQFTVLLCVTRVLGAVARRFKQPSVMGEVIAGVLLGPSVLGHLSPGVQAFIFPKDQQQSGLLELLSWIGMILLMFRTGIDTDVSRWRTLKGAALLASTCGIAIPFAIGMAIGLVVPANAGGSQRPARLPSLEGGGSRVSNLRHSGQVTFARLAVQPHGGGIGLPQSGAFPRSS